MNLLISAKLSIIKRFETAKIHQSLRSQNMLNRDAYKAMACQSERPVCKNGKRLPCYSSIKYSVSVRFSTEKAMPTFTTRRGSVA